jgi:hypothetical protein
MGVDKIMTEVDPEARRAYEERAVRGAPGAEPEAGGGERRAA